MAKIESWGRKIVLPNKIVDSMQRVRRYQWSGRKLGIFHLSQNDWERLTTFWTAIIQSR